MTAYMVPCRRRVLGPYDVLLVTTLENGSRERAALEATIYHMMWKYFNKQ